MSVAMVTLKTAAEIETMRRAGRIAATALRAALDAVRPGVTTAALDRIVERVITDHGASPSFLRYRGYPASACISVNDEVVHGIPGDRTLGDGDLVSLDLGAKLDGLHADLAYTVGVGEVGAEAQRLLGVTAGALEAGIAAAQPGARLGDVGATIQRHVEAAGFAVVREFAGHGIGRSLHEDPQVANYGRPGSGPVLRPGMTLAIEPMVTAGGWEVTIDADGWTVRTRDGSLAAHFEHTVAITADGPVVLTGLDG